MKFFDWILKVSESFVFGLSILTVLAFWILLIGFAVGQQEGSVAGIWPAISAIGSIGVLVVALLVRDDFRKNFKFSRKIIAAENVLKSKVVNNLVSYSMDMTRLISLLRQVHEEDEDANESVAKKCILDLKRLQNSIDKCVTIFWELKSDIDMLPEHESIKIAYDEAKHWLAEINAVFGLSIYFKIRSMENQVDIYNDLKSYLKFELTDANSSSRDEWSIDAFVYGDLWRNKPEEAAQLGDAIHNAAKKIVNTY